MKSLLSSCQTNVLEYNIIYYNDFNNAIVVIWDGALISVSKIHKGDENAE